MISRGECNKYRIAFLTSHVIQYQGPLFKKIAESSRIDFTVLFYSKQGISDYMDREFGTEVNWGRNLLNGYKHKFINNYSPIKSYERFFSYLNFGIFNELASNRYDAVIIYGYARFISWYAWLSALILRIPILFIGETNLLQHIRRSGARRWFKEKLLRIFFSRCKVILYLGALNKEYYKYFGVRDAKLFHWPYAVDNIFFKEQSLKFKPKVSDIKLSYGLPQDKILILFSGKLVAKKCPLVLLEAYKEMSHRNKSSLVFVGDGPLMKEMKKYVDTYGLKDVYFLGFLNQSELAKIYAACDIFVFPSYYEPWGLVLNEAMCFGLPVIVSDQISAGYDLVKDGYNGYIFKTNEAKCLKDRLDELATNPDLRKHMGERSKVIISSWNYDKDVQGLLEALAYIKHQQNTEAMSNA